MGGVLVFHLLEHQRQHQEQDLGSSDTWQRPRSTSLCRAFQRRAVQRKISNRPSAGLYTESERKTENLSEKKMAEKINGRRDGLGKRRQKKKKKKKKKKGNKVEDQAEDEQEEQEQEEGETRIKKGTREIKE